MCCCCCCCLCCLNLTPKALIITLLVFSFIIFELSFDSILFRLASTERYKKALVYLNEKDNDNDLSFPKFCYHKFDDEFRNIIDFNSNGYYCYIGPVSYLKQSKEIGSPSLYKNWKKTDIALNIIRILITFSCFVFLLLVLLKYFNIIKDSKNESKKNKYLYIYFLTTLILSIFIFVYSLIYIILRAQVNNTDYDIGLYTTITAQIDEWTSVLMAGHSLDGSLIVISIVFFCLSILLKRAMNRDISQQQPNGPIIVQYRQSENNNENIEIHESSPDGRQVKVAKSEERQINPKP